MSIISRGELGVEFFAGGREWCGEDKIYAIRIEAILCYFLFYLEYIYDDLFRLDLGWFRFIFILFRLDLGWLRFIFSKFPFIIFLEI